ncbi:MAG: ClpXP protease specificity-enhancing factor [Gammaproteobacteria bacterium]|nr:ClpXP protease specificity-enhancing factor [Gammaproteobacteria bacterium]
MSSVTSKPKLTSSKPYLIKALYEWMLDNGLTPHIVVDTTLPGVRVPKQSIKNGQIILNISPNATSHFEMTLSKLQFRAGFGATIFDVLLPTSAVEAIYARENGEGMTFSMDIPGGDDGGDGSSENLTFTETADPESKQDTKKPAKPSHLKIVK